MKGKDLSRREFLRMVSLAGTGALVAACQPQVVEKIVKETIIVEKVVTQVVKETVIVEGVSKEVTRVVEKVVTIAPVPELEGDLEVWVYPMTENDKEIVYDPIYERFKEVYPTIKVTFDVQAWRGRREKLYVAAAAGEPPDAWLCESDSQRAYIEKGVILPLTDLIDPELLSDYSEVDLEQYTYGGKLHALPMRTAVWGIGYNAALMEEYGVDPEVGIETWDEHYALSVSAKSKGWYSESPSTFEWVLFVSTVYEAGGTVHSPDRTKTNLREQPCIDALNWFATLFKEGFAAKEFAVGTADQATVLPNYFGEGKQVIYRGSEGITRFASQTPTFPFNTGKPRHKAAGYPLISGGLVSEGWAVTTGSEQKEAALELIKFLARPETLGLWGTLTGMIPPGTKSKTYWKADPILMKWAEAHYPHLYYDQDINTLWQESKVIMAPHIQAAVLGVETVEEALDMAAKELEEVIIEKAG